MSDVEQLPGPERRRKSRVDMWRDGDLPTDVLDDEEVWRGFPRNHDGRFGRGPGHIPTARYRELTRRRQEAGVQAIQALTPVAVRLLDDVMLSPEASYTEKLRAVQLVLERSVPKVVETVDVQVTEKPYERLLASSSTIWRQLPATDAEVVE